MNPAHRGSTDRFHRRIEVLVSSAIRAECVRLEVVHCPSDSATREIIISTVELTEDAHETARSIVDHVVLTLQEEASCLPDGFHAFSVRGFASGQTEDCVRERIRLPGTAAAPAADRLARAEASDILEDERALESRSGLAHPRETATLAGIIRQQMRHNEAIMATLVKSTGASTEIQSRMIAQLGERVVDLTDKLAKNSDLFLDAHRRTRLIEAEARSADMKAEALKVGGTVLAEYLPVALHRITRKYGLAGDAEVDPLLEKVVSSFDEKQIEQLGGLLTPVQQALFAEMWMTVQARREKREETNKTTT